MTGGAAAAKTPVGATATALTEAPGFMVNVFVAGFIGSPAMNLFEGHLDNGRIVLPTASIPIPKSAHERFPALGGYDGQPLIFGISPEDLYDSKLDSGSRLATIPAKVM